MGTSHEDPRIKSLAVHSSNLTPAEGLGLTETEGPRNHLSFGLKIGKYRGQLILRGSAGLTFAEKAS